jgi:probable phosphoglycerate mutase
MVRVIVIRPGTTDFDEQGRIKGNLDIPLNEFGKDQVVRTANELAGQAIEIVYSAPCQAARETAAVLSRAWAVRSKELTGLRNLDHGLWQGKTIDEVKTTQRKVYRLWQEQPATVCPPEGEMLRSAQQRVQGVLDKLLKKHKSGVLAIVVPEPLASLIRCYLSRSELGDLWLAETRSGSWDSLDVQPAQVVPGHTS